MQYCTLPLWATLAASAVASSCGGETPSSSRNVLATPPAPVATVISIQPDSIGMAIGDSMQFSAVVRDQYDAVLPTPITWSMAAGPLNASVSATGMARASAEGIAVVQAASGRLNAHALLAVRDSAGGGAPPPPPPPPPPQSTTGADLAVLPQQTVNVALVAPTGRVISVSAGGNLQAAINSAQRGDVIMLEAGATFTGPFTLPDKPGTGWITIRSAAPDANLPAFGQRISPTYAPLLPKLVVARNNDIVINTQPGADSYRLMFLEIGVAPNVTTLNSLVRLGDPNGNQTSNMPTGLIIDRSYIHGEPSLNLVRCVLLSSAATAIIGSHLSDCHAEGVDSQAIVAWNGRGPFRISNNYLSGAGENLMLGGADPATPNLLPEDVEIVGNHFHKPDSWKGSKWSIKNLLEIKFGRRVLIEGNVFEGNWLASQTGYALNLKSSASNSWAVTEDITVRYNEILNVGAGISLLAFEGVTKLPANRITIVDNVIHSVNTASFNGAGNLFQILQGVRNVTIEHNTIVTTGTVASALVVTNPPIAGFTFRNNIITRGTYGVKGSGTAEGSATLDRYAPGGDVRANVFIGSTSAKYPSGNFIAPSPTAIGFNGFASNDLSLSTSSPYARRATTGRDVGADIARVKLVTAGVVLP